MTADIIITQLAAALKRFGTYSFDDKGAHEVMDLDSVVTTLRKMTAEEAANVIRDVSHCTKHGKHRGVRLASALLEEMQEWDALFEQPDMEALL